VIRAIDGVLDSVEWINGVFDRAMTYTTSLVSGISQGGDCILLQIRQAGGVLEQWQLEKGIVTSYSKWLNATEKGAAAAVDAVVRIEREGERIVKHIFKQGVAVSS
jgi:hypothetical protein